MLILLFKRIVNKEKVTHGIPIHNASFFSTSSPLSEKNLAAPMGETAIGRHGKKYLVSSKGEKKATPSPPFVMASRTACEAVHEKKNDTKAKNDFNENDLIENTMAHATAKIKANNKECEKPRCPQKLSYGIPILKVMTSRSGTIVHTDPIKMTCHELTNLGSALPSEAAIITCPKADAI